MKKLIQLECPTQHKVSSALSASAYSQKKTYSINQMTALTLKMQAETQLYSELVFADDVTAS